MQALSTEAIRAIFRSLSAPTLASVLNSSPTCRKTLNKASISVGMLNTEQTRLAVCTKILPTLRKESVLCQSLEQAWTEEWSQVVSRVREMEQDEAALSAFLSEQPQEIRETLAALALIPKTLPLQPEPPAPNHESNVGASPIEASRNTLEALKKELTHLRKQLKAKQGKDGKEREKVQYELATSRKRLGETRTRLTKAELDVETANQERTTLVTRVAYLEKQGREKAQEVIDLQGQVQRLHTALTATQAVTREVTATAEAAERARDANWSALRHARENQRQEQLTQNLLTLLLAPPSETEKPQMKYASLKASRDLRRVLAEAATTGPADLLQVWTAWLRQEEETIALIAGRPGIPSVDELQEQIDLIWDLDTHLNLRVSLIQQLRLINSRLLLHYEETGGQQSLD